MVVIQIVIIQGRIVKEGRSNMFELVYDYYEEDGSSSLGMRESYYDRAEAVHNYESLRLAKGYENIELIELESEEF